MTAFNSYNATTASDAPIRAYHLGDATVTSGSSIVDSGSQTQNGTVSGSGLTSVSGLIRGSTDKAVNFASSSYITVPTTSLPSGTSAWSMEAWVQMPGSLPGGTPVVMCFGSASSAWNAAYLLYHASSTCFSIANASALIMNGPGSVVASGVYHVVVTWNGTQATLYVNGSVAAGPTTQSFNIAYTSGFAYIGNDNMSDFWSGVIDEAYWYSSALSSTQVSNHYNAGLAITKTLGVRTRLVGSGSRVLGVRTRLQAASTRSLGVRTRLLVIPQVLIANTQVLFDEDTWQLHLKADERQRFQATILDYAGTSRYSRSEQVSVTDPTLGTLFSGVLIQDDLDKSNTYPDATIEHQIDTVGNEYFVEKRTSSRLYTTPTYASKIVFDAVNDNLAAEGIIAPSAQSFVSTQADWGTGTLSSVVATGNVGDGDLELANNGSVVSASYLVQSDWSSGTLSNLVANAGGDLSLIGATRNWDDGSTSGQTLYGNGSPSQGVTSGQYTLSCAANNMTQSRLDFAGTWANGTIDVDMVLGNNSDKHSLTWRTQHWNNTDDYAYTLEFWPNTIQIKVGQNANGGTNSQIVGHNFSPALAAGTYHVRVVLNGSNFTAYVNGTQCLTVSDSTYSTAGYISLRNRNSTGASVTDAFDNFGIMQALSGTWTSASTSINSVSSIASSVITWDSSLSQGGTVLVQSSIDGGGTYQMCTSGSPIPGLTSGTSGTGKSVIIKITLSTTTSATMPDLKSLQWSVVGGYSASGTRIATLSLTPVGRAGSSVVAWNVNLPSTATTLGVDVSLDNGTTWTDVSGNNGGPIPGLNGQPEPTVDGFATDTSANYITGIGYGGGMATWTQDTANSRIVAMNGASSVYLNATIDIANIDLFCDMDYSDAGGLAWCFEDAQNYYGLIVADNQASIGTKNRMTLYKTSGGVQSTLATGTIAFQRGMWYRIRVTNLDGVITASFDGVQILTYTDSSPLGAGQAGLYQAGGLTTNYALRTLGPTLDLGITGGTPTMARFYQLWLQPMGDNVTGQNVTTRLRLATTDATLTPQVLDLTVGVYSNTIGIGALIPSADYRMQFQSKVLDDAAKQSNYAWWVDPYKVLNFRERNAVPAPWILQSTSLALPVDLEVDSNLKVTVANDLFRNRQNLTGVLNTGQFPGRSFQGDGQTTSFTLDFPIAPGTVPVITLNTVPQKVGLKGTTGSQYYYADNDAVIAQDNALTKLVSTDRLVVSFTGIFTTTVTRNNLASQAALAPKEGGTGIVEAVEDVSSRNMMYAAAVAYADQLLARYCIDGNTITYATYRNGLQPLQIQSVFLPEMGLYDTQMLITAIDVTMRSQPGSTVLYQYIVTASELANQGSWKKLLAAGLLFT